MNDILTQHFLSLEWDKGYLSTLKNLLITEETIMSDLDNVFQEWSCETTNIVSVNNNLVVSINLYLPGRILSNTGNCVNNAITSIIKNLIGPVNQQSITNIQNDINTNSPKLTSDSVVQKLEQIKQNAVNNVTNNNNQVFDELINFAQEQQPAVPGQNIMANEIPETALFDSPESRRAEAEFQQYGTIGINEPVVQPTAQEVNPNNQIYGNNAWNVETGTKLKTWMKSNDIKNPEQLSAWLTRYCGLDYEHFNPQWIDNFIAWAESLRERQTY